MRITRGGKEASVKHLSVLRGGEIFLPRNIRTFLRKESGGEGEAWLRRGRNPV